MSKNVNLTDAVIGRPFGFSVGHRHFYLYPATLGKVLLLQQQTEKLGINTTWLGINYAIEALRLVKQKKDVCLEIVAYSTCKDKEEVFDNNLISERKKIFGKELSEEELASLLVSTLTYDETQTFLDDCGITAELKRKSDIIRIKEKRSKNNLFFGGKTIYGTLIDAACERYGWTKDYVVWGIDYISLRLMLADKIDTLFLSDEERKKIPGRLLTGAEDVIRATKENMARIKAMDWK